MSRLGLAWAHRDTEAHRRSGAEIRARRSLSKSKWRRRTTFQLVTLAKICERCATRVRNMERIRNEIVFFGVWWRDIFSSRLVAPSGHRPRGGLRGASGAPGLPR